MFLESPAQGFSGRKLDVDQAVDTFDSIQPNCEYYCCVLKSVLLQFLVWLGKRRSTALARRACKTNPPAAVVPPSIARHESGSSPERPEECGFWPQPCFGQRPACELIRVPSMKQSVDAFRPILLSRPPSKFSNRHITHRSTRTCSAKLRARIAQRRLVTLAIFAEASAAFGIPAN